MKPRFVSSQNSGIVGDQQYSAIVAFKDVDIYPSGGVRTLTFMGDPVGNPGSKYRLQLVTDTALGLSGYLSDAIVAHGGTLRTTAHLWACTYLGGRKTSLFWNGATHSKDVADVWNTADSPLRIGADPFNYYPFNGGMKFVLVINRALSESEMASVARWSWETHKVGFQASGGALSLSSYLVNTTGVVMTVSFLIAPAGQATALKLISLTGLRFSALNATAASASCSNLNPPNVGVSAVFTPSTGVLLLNLSAAAIPALPTAAIVCKVAGFTNAAASPFLCGGNGFIQIGDWRFGIPMTFGVNHHFSFSHRNGKTNIILRSDGSYFAGAGRVDYGHWHLPISWTSSTDNVYDLKNLSNVLFGTSWIDFGPNVRLGTFDNVELHLSFRETCCHNTWSPGHSTFGIHTAGIDAHK